MRIALFASGNGSNVQAILEAISAGELTVEVAAFFCDNPKAYVLERLKAFKKIPTLVLSPKMCPDRQDYENKILNFLEQEQVEMIVLAGYMRVIGPTLLAAYPQKIMNIHPSLLPLHPGRHGIEDAFKAGDKETGITIHWVDEGIDSGPIIHQERFSIDPSWSLDQLESQIHQLEHRIYPQVIQRMSQQS
ncbi:phosphoribosylglycinamide formyltransferase [Vaginisenegalia massiliensis]|uniref:phosphoribosylglycinamide formyltransferase n=1 Tax=Vaginisenegalia massiliensis TaxID=2058294 RepID=UPI000F51B02B|nr:phosphoribosylglycinamide formyltransferase [Vaginisenegalia massiliensis]